MEALTNIAAMLSGKSIVVPNYQRAYSWETDLTDKSQKQVNTFLTDLQNYVNSKSSGPYYLGHFLLEERNTFEYGIIDGQQRLTTSVIFISALYRRLKEIKKQKASKILMMIYTLLIATQSSKVHHTDFPLLNMIINCSEIM